MGANVLWSIVGLSVKYQIYTNLSRLYKNNYWNSKELLNCMNIK